MTTDRLPEETGTPREIVQELDRFIVGQKEAKRAVAIAMRNRWRRLQVPADLREEITPNNIIMIGPTGVGKTEIARRLSRLAGAPFIKVEASKFTEVGYVGRDVESMIRELTELAVNMVKSEKAKEVEQRAERIAEDRILDILLPRPSGSPSTPQTDTGSSSSEFEQTREKFREMLRKGTLDHRTVEVDVAASQVPSMQVLGPMNLDDMGINLQDMLGNILPKKTKQRRMTVAEAKRLLTQEEAQKLVDADAATREAIRRVEISGIVFLDEIDKIASAKSQSGGGPDVSREGVQRDLLPIVEGSNVTTKYGMVRTDHILFIASGAFHVAKPSDLIPELQGRFPIRVELQSLTKEDFVRILTMSENALLKQYAALLLTEGVTLTFDESAVEEIAALATEVNTNVENIGARRLHTILTTLLDELLFSTPKDGGPTEATITGAYVQEKLSTLVKNRDLSRYIL